MNFPQKKGDHDDEKVKWPRRRMPAVGNIEINRLLKVSVVIPSYNHGSSIEEAICSVINQSYPLVECVVIDGGSTDDTTEILQRYDSKIHYWTTEKDEGVYDAMNKGIDHASGEFIFFLGSDDILAGPDVLTSVFF